MQGFIASYFNKQRNVEHSHKMMYYFAPEKLPVLTTLAREFAVFNRWFASIPGPTLCNRAFAHYGTSFGHVGMELFYVNTKFKSIYQRVIDRGQTAKLYYFDQVSSTLEVINLLQDQPQLFATYTQFLDDCRSGTLPDYCFVEPNYSDHDGDGGAVIASDQHPDHHVGEGERFIASIYNAIQDNPALWASTALLITYDEHGGIYDHVLPRPACRTGSWRSRTRRKPASRFISIAWACASRPILVSPWVQKGTVVHKRADGTERMFEHASIPNTVSKWLIPDFNDNDDSPREAAAETFLDLLTLPVMRPDCPEFTL